MTPTPDPLRDGLCGVCGHDATEHATTQDGQLVCGQHTGYYHPATPDPLREALARHIGKSGWVRPVGDPPDHDRAWRHMIREAEAMLDDPAIAAALAQPAPALDVERLAYTLIVSSVPALYRSWRSSPNETTARLNRLLLDESVKWLQNHQRITGREVEDFREYAAPGDPT